MAFFTGFFPIFYYEENRLPGQSLFPSAPYAKLESQDQQGGIYHMEFRVLKYFLMVAREENITHAAELLHITQPTLSRQLIQLEEELGVKLFQRSKHRIVLTEEGILLRRRAEEQLPGDGGRRRERAERAKARRVQPPRAVNEADVALIDRLREEIGGHVRLDAHTVLLPKARAGKFSPPPLDVDKVGKWTERRERPNSNSPC